MPGIGEVSPGALIKMLKQDGNSKSLASPHMLTSNNEKATFKSGDTLFYTTSVTNATGIISEKVEKLNVDLKLDIKPNISHSNYVTMDIELDANTGKVSGNKPSVSTRRSKQIVTVKSGQTIVISGLTKTEESEKYRKIPLLGDLPLIGWLFRNTTLTKTRSTLMVFIRPFVVHGSQDLAAIYEKKVDERDEFLNKVYGSQFKKSDFYTKLPKRGDADVKQDAFDVAEEQTREDLKKQLERDMGYKTGVEAGAEEDVPPIDETPISIPSAVMDSDDSDPLPSPSYDSLNAAPDFTDERPVVVPDLSGESSRDGGDDDRNEDKNESQTSEETSLNDE